MVEINIEKVLSHMGIHRVYKCDGTLTTPAERGYAELIIMLWEIGRLTGNEDAVDEISKKLDLIVYSKEA